MLLPHPLEMILRATSPKTVRPRREGDEARGALERAALVGVRR